MDRPRGMSPLRVAFVDQQGDETGGAEESLALLLAHLPPSIEPHVVLFNGGRFADRLRAKGLDVHVLPVEDAITSTTSEQLSLRGGAAVPAATFALASHFRRTHVELVHTNTIKAHVIGGGAARPAGQPSL